MLEQVRGKRQFVRSSGLGLALLLAVTCLTPLGKSSRLSAAAPGPDAKAAAQSGARAAAVTLKPEARKRIAEAYLHLPLIFEANQGQTSRGVKFLSRGNAYTLFLTANEAVFALRQLSAVRSKLPKPVTNHEPRTTNHGQRTKDAVLRMKLVGANSSARVTGLDELPGKSNYFIGNNSTGWHTGIPQYSRVEYNAVYPGVNLVYYGSQGRLEYDFDLAPGVKPGNIAFSIDGLSETPNAAAAHARPALRVDSHGDLVMNTAAGAVGFAKPVAYQVSRDAAGAVHKSFANARYVVKNVNASGHAQVGFEVRNYDRHLPMVIDPTLTYSTYIGGSLLDQAQSVALDSSGNAYVTGTTQSTNFPNQPGTIQPGGCGGTCQGNVFVMELNPSTSTLVYSTYLGGNGVDVGYGIAVDSSGDAYVAGETTSTTFPIAGDAYLTSCHGTNSNHCDDGFVSELTAHGATLSYSTYFGGSGNDAAYALALDSKNDVFIGGSTTSIDLPVSATPVQKTCGSCGAGLPDGFMALLDITKPPLTALSYGTYLGGSASDFIKALAFDSQGNVYMTGETKSTNFPTTTGAYQTTCTLDTASACEGDAFVSKITPTTIGSTALIYSTRLGGAGEESGNGIAVDSAFDAYVAGFTTSSTDFPTKNPFQPSYGGGSEDAFVTKLNPGGTALIFSTYLGGGDDDTANGIGLGPNDTVYVVGRSKSTNFPVTHNAYQGTSGGGNDATLTSFDSSGTGLLFSTYLGGSVYDEGNGLLVDAGGNAYVTGFTESTNFPTANPTTAACAGACGLNDVSNLGDAFLSELGSLTVPFAYFNPSSVDFGNQNVGTSSSPQQIQLTNTGNAALTVSTVVLGGADAGDFTESDNCVSTSPLSPGANCTANVTFKPTALGSRTATLTYTDTANNSPQTVNLSGTGQQVSLSISPTSLTFSNQPPNTTSPPQTVTLKNTGTGTITFTNVTVTGPYAFATGTTCTSSTQLTSNQTCVMNVTFTPTGLGAENGSIALTDDAPGSPQTVPLTGNGAAAGVMFSPTSLSFGNVAVGQASKPQNVTIKNNGNINLTVTQVSTAGADAADFSATAAGCNSVAPNATCTVIVSFKPAAPGARAATLSVTDNAPASPQTLPLTGTGTGPGASLSPATGLNFGSQGVGTSSNAQPVTLTNTGTAALTISGITIGGANAADFSQTNACGSSLAAKANCAISVTFKPAAGGNRAGTLSVADNAAGSPQTVPLTGAGSDFTITATTTTESVSPGGTATYNTVSLTPQGGFNQQISLACSGQPAASTCSVSPNSVTPSGSAVPLTVTVVTTASSLAPPISRGLPPLNGPGRGWFLGFAILGLLTLGTLVAQKRTRRVAWILAPIMLWVLMASACGGNSTSSSGGGTSGTPAGTSTLVVTGTAGTLKHSLNLTLTVQ